MAKVYIIDIRRNVYFMIQRKDRKAAVITAAIIIATIILGIVFACVFSSHCHEDHLLHGDCIICRSLEAADGELHGAKAKAEKVIVPSVVFAVVLCVAFAAENRKKFSSPISLKVKLSL